MKNVCKSFLSSSVSSKTTVKGISTAYSMVGWEGSSLTRVLCNLELTLVNTSNYISVDHMRGRDQPLHIPMGAYFPTNSFHLTIRKYIYTDLELATHNLSAIITPLYISMALHAYV